MILLPSFQNILQVSSLILLLTKQSNVRILFADTCQPKMMVLDVKELNAIMLALHTYMNISKDICCLCFFQNANKKTKERILFSHHSEKLPFL